MKILSGISENRFSVKHQRRTILDKNLYKCTERDIALHLSSALEA